MTADEMKLVDYTVSDGIAVIVMDDGKVNALSPRMLGAVNAALDRADDDRVNALVLAGRPGRFSAGFDLDVLRAGGPEAEGMLRSGFQLAERLLGGPRPVVTACTGHAIAMGAFLVCAGDFRVGAAGPFKIQANEVAIGLPMPHPAIAILRHRLTPSAFDRAVGLAEAWTSGDAVAVGWLDCVVEPAAVMHTALEVAASFGGLDPAAHRESKLRARATVLVEVRRGIESEFSS